MQKAEADFANDCMMDARMAVGRENRVIMVAL
jgi:hypothetical protein